MNLNHNRGKEESGLGGEVSEQLGQAVDWAKERLHGAKEQIAQVESRAKDAVAHVSEQTQEGLGVVDRWLRKTAKERPLLVVGSSMGAGFLLGLVLLGGKKHKDSN